MPPALTEDRYALSGGPDFAKLGQAVPALAAVLREAKAGSGRLTIDWKDEQAMRILTAATLKVDFGLNVALDKDRLCPIVPGRLEYIVFILNLTLTTFYPHLTPSDPPPALTGLDIGTGSSCIYALLATALLPAGQLSMVGTECDSHSIACAKANVAKNGLEKRIDVVETLAEGAILPPQVFQEPRRVDFTMCNPPFYSSEEEIQQLEDEKELAPFAVCTGARNEMITAGGEVAFVLRMIKQSLDLPPRTLFSSLLGKYSSLAQIVAALKADKVENYAIRVLERGWTRRWIVVWTRSDRRLPDSLRPGKESGVGLGLLPPANDRTYVCAEGLGSEEVKAAMERAWEEAGVQIRRDEDPERWTIIAHTNTWSRAARRARARGTPPAALSSSAPLLELRVHLTLATPAGESEADNIDSSYEATLKRKRELGTGPRMVVHASWTRGLDKDRGELLGLWGLVCRRLGEASGVGKKTKADVEG